MSNIIKLDKRRLEKLYLKNKLGSYEIAKILGCSASHIRDSLREYSIKSRSVQEAKALTKPKYARYNFSGNLEEKAYLIGFRLGDLHVSKTHPNSPTIRVSTNTTKKEQVRLCKDLFSKYGYVKQYSRDKNGATSVRAFVNNTFGFLLKKEDGVDEWILKNKKYLNSFIAGYADAEGTFCVCDGDGVFSLKSQDKNIVWKIYKGFNEMGILCKPPYMYLPAGHIDRRGVKNNKDAWILTVYRKDSLLKLISVFKSLIKHKKRFSDMLLVEKNIKVRNIKYNNKKDVRWYKTYPGYERT